MEIGIHEMIIGLLKNQFRQDNEGDDQSQALCEILIFIHGPYSIQVRDAIVAPRHDLEYYTKHVKNLLWEYLGMILTEPYRLV